MVLPLLFVSLVYGISSTPDACAVPPDPGYMSDPQRCSAVNQEGSIIECCWTETVPDVTTEAIPEPPPEE